jgi:NTP pyrophosphatase (non-canonical NTP hydrolase)
MEAALKANDHKHGWRNDTGYELHHRLKQEVGELGEAIGIRSKQLWDRTTGDYYFKDTYEPDTAKYDTVLAEAADVANFAMMIADNLAAQTEAGDGR